MGVVIAMLTAWGVPEADMNPILIVVLVAIFFVLLSRSFLRRGDISGADARALVERGAKLVDVRTAAEYAGGHLPGAIHHPLQELGARARSLGPKDGPVVVYCLSGHRSRQAKRLLLASGFTAVNDLGAMRHW